MQKIKRCSVWLLAAFLMSGCGKQIESGVPALIEPVSVSMDIIEVTRDDIYEITTCDAQLIPVTESVVAGKTGVLEEFYVREGDRVRTGELLGRLSDEAVRQQLKALQEQIQYTREQNALSNEIAENNCELKKLELMDKQEYLSEKERALMELEVERAELLLKQQQEQQQLELSYLTKQEEELSGQLLECNITAPVSGEVVYVQMVKPGSYVQEGSVLVLLASETKMQVRADFIPDGTLKGCEISQIWYQGSYIPVEPVPYERSEYVASVLRNGSFYSYFTLPEGNLNEVAGKEIGLRTGDYVQLQLIKNQRSQVCVLPVTCLHHDSNGYYVYRIEEDGSRVKAAVAVGVQNELMAEITDGLKEGDMVHTGARQKVGNTSETVIVSKGDFARSVGFDGSVYYPETYDLFYEGKKAVLTEWKVVNGSKVKKGDVIATIQVEYDEIELAELEMKLKQTEKEYKWNLSDQKKVLAEKALNWREAETDAEKQKAELIYRNQEKQISQYQLMMEQQIAAQKEQLTQFRKAIEQTEIVADESGVISELAYLHPGDTVEAGKKLVSLYNPDVVWMKLNDASAALRYGMDVQIETGHARNRTVLQGRVVEADNLLPDALRKGTAYVEIFDCPKDIVWDNTSIKVDLVAIEDVLLVDRRAVETSEGNSYVYVLKNGSLHKQQVLRAGQGADKSWILMGVQEGQELIIP